MCEPDSVFVINGQSICTAFARFELRKEPPIGKASIVIFVECINTGPERIDMVKGFSIVGDGWSIGHFIGTVPFGITPIWIDPIKPAGGVEFKIIHTSRPDPSFRIDFGIIKTVFRNFRFRIHHFFTDSTFQVHTINTGFTSCDEIRSPLTW